MALSEKGIIFSKAMEGENRILSRKTAFTSSCMPPSSHTGLLVAILTYSFTVRLFKECADAKVLFGFPADMDATSPELLTSKRFIMQGTYLIQMLDTALNMLGPDIELLGEIMADLGAKHVRYGVKPEMFAIMGDALIITLKETLGKDIMNESTTAAWKETYAELSTDMIAAMKK